MSKPLVVGALAIALMSSFSLAGCSNKEEAGTLTGAVVGGVIGNQFGKGGGKVAATFAGAVIGGIAEYDAWERGTPGRPVRWRNPDNGRYGEIVPEAYYDRGGSRCRDFVHFVWIEGRKREMRGTACRNPDGTWTQVS
jgi:surface antigen